MMPRSKGHLRIDDNVIFCLGNIMVESTMNDTAISNHDRLEKILFPFLIPVFVFSLCKSVFDLRVRQRKLFNACLDGGFVIQIFLYVGSNTIFLFNKTFKAGITQYGGKNIICRFCAGRGAESKF